MFRGVKFGTINASQLFFEGSHVFSIFLFLFNLRIHACNKNKITTFYRWQWKYLTISDSSAVKICSIKAITVSKFVSSSKSFKKQWTLWDHVIPSAFYSFHLISFTQISRGPSHHKSGSLNNKYEYHSTSQSKKRKSPMSNPFRHLVRATPKTTRKPFRGHGRRCWPRPPWPPQRSTARPRRRGLPEPRNAAASGLGRRGCDADGGAAAAAVEKQNVPNGMFLRVVGQIFLDRS